MQNNLLFAQALSHLNMVDRDTDVITQPFHDAHQRTRHACQLFCVYDEMQNGTYVFIAHSDAR